MFGSPVVQSALNSSGFVSKYSHVGAINCYGKPHLNFMDEQIHNYNSSPEVSGCNESAGSCGSRNRGGGCSSRSQLEKDIRMLNHQLQQELELHATLESAIERNAIKVSTPAGLPRHAQELLSSISALEVTVSKLQQEMVSLHFQLSQERNERRLAEYRLTHSSSQDSSSSSPQNSSVAQMSHSEGNSREVLREEPSESTSNSMEFSIENAAESVACDSVSKVSTVKDFKTCQPVRFEILRKGLPPTGLWGHPNKLSEEMVRCMKNIFISLADSSTPSKSSTLESSNSPSLSPSGHLSNSSMWSLSNRSVVSSWVQSPRIDVHSSSDVLAMENACDPYRVRGKLSWADIGSYRSAIEVSWMSVEKEQLEYASGALRKFRTLVEQLAKVNPVHLSGNARLAFWMNLYNALIMHAYLAYGVPRSDLKLFSLLQKAAYTVGGHSFNAAAIEYAILKMKPPAHRPQIALLLALHKLKVTEEQRKFAIDTFEPLVTFALSCGMHSSPAVRIYTAKNVKDELQEAQHDFIRASVGVSDKGRLLVPKMLHCFARSFVDDANLAVWISRYLPSHQAAFVEKCMSQRRQSLLGSRNCGILSFDSHFRYLFLPA